MNDIKKLFVDIIDHDETHIVMSVCEYPFRFKKTFYSMGMWIAFFFLFHISR
jgi:hypothetical protein